MRRILIIITIATLATACSPNGKWQDYRLEDQSNTEEMPINNTVTPPVTSESQTGIKMSPGASQVDGTQLSGSVSVSNETTTKGTGIYAKIQMSISTN